jgi:hypothetical protein
VLTWGYIGLLILWGGAASFVVALTMTLTNPLTIGPIGVTLWFLLLFTDVAALVTVGLYGLKRYLKIHSSARNRLRYSWRQGLLVAGFTVGVLALSSLHQISLRDVVLLGLIAVIIEGYVRLRWP